MLSTSEFWRVIHGNRECGMFTYDPWNYHSRFDWNGDGRLDFNEFTQGYLYSDNAATDLKVQSAFKMVDCSGDGTVSPNEL